MVTLVELSGVGAVAKTRGKGRRGKDREPFSKGFKLCSMRDKRWRSYTA